MRARLLVIIAIVVIAIGAAVTWYAVNRHGLREATTAAPLPTHEVWTCPMHPEVQEHMPGKCPKCGMDLVRADAATERKETAEAPATRAPVELDTRRRQLLGVKTARAERGIMAREIRAVGIVRYDETRLADINLKLDGWIKKLYVETTGQAIRRGQPLLDLYSPELLAAQQEFLLALSTRDSMQTSQVEDARVQSERLVESARQRLALWDLPAEELRRLESTRKANPTVTFPSPVNGFITEKTAVEGMRVMAGQTLYKVADLSTVWVEADVFESDAPFVRTGESAIVTLDAWPGESLRGKAVYIYPFVEEKTRTMKVRYAFANPRLRLKPGMYANVAMQASLGSGVLIPADALLDTGRQQLVFVAEGNGNFQPRDVHAGHRDGERVQIISGLKEGEEVATAAAFFLDSESQLRAAAGGWSAPAPGDSGSQAASQYTFTLRTQPDPPRNGQNTFEVRVTDAKGQPVTDAQVTVTLFMAAMPSMNMPAMSSEARLPHVGAGTYRGDGMVSMAGRWDVTMTARRGGSVLGSGRTTLVAR